MKLTPLILISLCSCAPLSAATYIEPQSSGRILFKADKIPLDTESINWISNLLLETAAAQSVGNATQLRSAAKCVAIASQISPANAKLQAVNTALTSGTRIDSVAPERLKKDTQKLWLFIDYLSQQPESSEAHNLSLYLMDTMLGISPQHRSLKGFKSPKKLWHNVIADFSQFDFVAEPELVSNERVIHDEIEPVVDDLPPAKVIKKASWKTLKQSILTPLTLKNKPSNQYNTNIFLSPELSSFTLTINPKKQGKGIQFKLQNGKSNTQQTKRLNKEINTALRPTWSEYSPATIALPIKPNYHKFHDSTQAAAILHLALDRSLAAQELRTDLFVLYSLNGSKSFGQPAKFWDSYELLTPKTDSSRILISQQSTENFQNQIVLDNPEFFIKNEVISVENIQQARLYSDTVDDVSIADATSLFKEVKDAISGKPIRVMATNKAVRNKLKEILKLSPNHVSARMLLLQGSRTKPRTLSSEYFHYRVSVMIKNFSYLPKANTYKINEDTTTTEAELLKSRIKELESYTSEEVSDLYKEVVKLSDTLRSMAKAKGKSSNYNSNNRGYHTRRTKEQLALSKALYKKISNIVAYTTK